MADDGGRKKLDPEARENLMEILEARFEENMARHEALQWKDVRSRLEARPEKLWSLSEMEKSGGEPDVVGWDAGSGEVLFFDCSPESPDGRRSVCYDDEALKARKKNKPAGSALALAGAMGAALLSEEQYRDLQNLGEFDARTSSWLLTPESIREKGGAIFGDYRYGTVFVYHNGAQSYYAARGFRCVLRI
jgi:hypothetical protein